MVARLDEEDVKRALQRHEARGARDTARSAPTRSRGRPPAPLDAGAPMIVAYFSLEFGLTEALPIYSGGLGVLAGDHLKAASDIGLPLVGVGLLYRQGFGRQRIDEYGGQYGVYPERPPSGQPLRRCRGQD